MTSSAPTSRTSSAASSPNEANACAISANAYIAAMTYIDASVAPLRKTGQIKLHGPAAFAGMRKAGALVAKCLDMLVDAVKPGVSTEKLDHLVADFARG